MDDDNENDDDLINGLNYFPLGYGEVFTRQKPEDKDRDKAILEGSTCSDWCRSVNAEYKLMLGDPKHNPNDPPDCFVTLGNKRLGVELVQLIEKEHKKRAIKGEDYNSGKFFEDMQWTEERFVSKLNKFIEEKGEKYLKKGLNIDVLVIYTVEPWLNAADAREWLAETTIKCHSNILSAFLLLDYEPSRGVDHLSVFKLYGDLDGKPSFP